MNNTPTTREELIEVMARAMCVKDACSTDYPCDKCDDEQFTGCNVLAAASLTALESAGVAVVPVEATEEMFGSGCAACDEYGMVTLKSGFSAMLSSSPYRKEGE